MALMRSRASNIFQAQEGIWFLYQSINRVILLHFGLQVKQKSCYFFFILPNISYEKKLECFWIFAKKVYNHIN